MKRFMTFLMLMLIVVGSSASAMAQKAKATAKRGKNDETIIYLHDKGPVLIGVQIEVRGKPHRERWEEGIRKLFEELDQDKGGILDEKEARGIPTR